MNIRLGIDIGRVIIAPDPSDATADTSFIGGPLRAALATPAYDGMFETVPALVKLFDAQVWLVSKAGPKVQAKTQQWLKHHRFFERTGISPKNLRFCLERSQKAEHCRKLRITHFVDDRSDVLKYLEGIVPHRFLFGPQRMDRTARDVCPVLTWADTAAAIELTLAINER